MSKPVEIAPRYKVGQVVEWRRIESDASHFGKIKEVKAWVSWERGGQPPRVSVQYDLEYSCTVDQAEIRRVLADE